MADDDWDAYENRPRPAERVGLVSATAEIEPCACGGDIVVIRNQETEIVSAILSHQHTSRHRAWRQREGIR